MKQRKTKKNSQVNNPTQIAIPAPNTQGITKQHLFYLLLILLLLTSASFIWIIGFRQKFLFPNFDKNSISDDRFEIFGNLKQWIDNCKISMPEQYINEIKNDGRSAWLPLIEDQVEKIRSVLLKKAKSGRFQEVLSRNEFEIEIVPQNDPRLIGKQETPPNARFIPSVNLQKEKHKILMLQDSDFSENEIEDILSNEFHHLSTLTATLKKIKDLTQQLPSSQSMLLPFLDSAWKVNPDLRIKHSNSIQSGMKEVNNFRQLLNSRNSKIFFDEDKKSKFNEYIKAFSDYQPAEFHQYIPNDHFTLLKHASEPVNNKLKIVIGGHTLYIHSSKKFGSETSIHYTYAKSDKIIDKAIAFLQQIDSYWHQTYQGPYSKVLSKDEQDMEFSSFIEEFPQSIKNTFFKDWCDYFSLYTEQKGYCNS